MLNNIQYRIFLLRRARGSKTKYNIFLLLLSYFFWLYIFNKSVGRKCISTYYILANGECKPQDIIYILLQLPVLSVASVSQPSQLSQISGNLIKKSLTSLQTSPVSDSLTSQRILLLAEITALLFHTKYSRPLPHHRNIYETHNLI